MKAMDLWYEIEECIAAGTLDPNAEVEFLLDGGGWNCGSSILNTLIVRDGDGNCKLFLTNFEKVIK